MATTTVTKILFRRGTLTDANTVVLSDGEPGWVNDSGEYSLYVGDGTSTPGIKVGSQAGGTFNYNDLTTVNITTTNSSTSETMSATKVVPNGGAGNMDGSTQYIWLTGATVSMLSEDSAGAYITSKADDTAGLAVFACNAGGTMAAEEVLTLGLGSLGNTCTTLSGNAWSIRQRYNGNVNETWGIKVNGDYDLGSSLSDERLKANIKDFEIKSPLSMVNKLKPKVFNKKHGTDISCEKYHGFIAQDMLKLLPVAVHNKDGEYLSFDYNSIPALLVKCVQELSAEVDDLKKELGSLYHQIN